MATTTQILRYVVDADTKGGVSGFKQVETQATATSGKLQGLIDKSPALGNALNSVGVDAGMLSGGLGQVATKLGPAALGAVITKGVSDFQNLGAEVLTFQRIAGTTAEESSRWVEVLGDYNISADQGAASIGKFAKVIGTTPGVLEKYGVQVQKNADGTVDLNATLLKASDVFRNTTDETKRAALGAALFGKSWQDMVPILEQGSGDIRKALDSVAQGKIMSQDDLDDAEDLRLAIDGLKDVVESLSVTVGRQFVPALKEVAEVAALTGGALDNGLTKSLIEASKWVTQFPYKMIKGFTDTLGELRDELGGTADGLGLVKGAMGALAGEQKKASDAAKVDLGVNRDLAKLKGEHAEVTQVLAEKEAFNARQTRLAEEAARNYAKQLAELTRRNEEVLKATQDLTHAHEIDLPAALDDVTESLLSYYETTKESQEAQKGLSESSAEYQLEAIKQRDAGRDLSASMMDYAREVLAAAEAQAALSGKQLTAEEKATILAGAMRDLGDKFPPLATKANELAGSFGGIAGAAEDAGERVVAAMQKMRDELVGIFNSIDIGNGLSMITATADRLDAAANRASSTRDTLNAISQASKVHGADAMNKAINGRT